MSPELSFSGLSVLVARIAPHSVATVHALLRDEARVTVAAALDDLPTSLRDLAERGLVTLAPQADPTAYDVVLRGDLSTSPAPTPGTAVTEGHPEVGTVTLLGGGLGDPGLLTVAGIEAVRQADVIVHDRLAPLSALRHARDDVHVVDVGKIPRGDFTPQERINDLLVEHALAGRNVLRMGVATLGAVAETLVAEGLSPETPAAVVADAGLPSMRTVRAPLRDIDARARRDGLGDPAVVVIGDV